MTLATVNEWYQFKQALDKKTCNKIKRLGQGKWEDSGVDTKKATTDEERKIGRKPDFKPNHQTRISEVFWSVDEWLCETIWPYMQEANQEAGWQYDIKAAESVQLTRYRKGGFYRFHTDGFGDHLSAYHNPQNAFLHGYVRKLSMSIMLNDNFEGGSFEFASYSKEKCEITPIEAKVGDIIVFPSSMEHRVAPITKGVRYSLVNWFLGPPFK